MRLLNEWSGVHMTCFGASRRDYVRLWRTAGTCCIRPPDLPRRLQIPAASRLTLSSSYIRVCVSRFGATRPEYIRLWYKTETWNHPPRFRQIHVKQFMRWISVGIWRLITFIDIKPIYLSRFLSVRDDFQCVSQFPFRNAPVPQDWRVTGRGS